MMGAAHSKVISEQTYRFWGAVASTTRMGWLGIRDGQKEMKATKIALFPLLMCIAARQGDIVVLEEHMQAGADVTVVDYEGRTPLHIAASEGDLETVQYLLRKGADYDVKDRSNETPLKVAMRAKSTDVVKSLCKESMYEVEDPCELGVELCYLVFADDLKQMEAWLASGINCNHADYDYRTPLHAAVNNNHLEMVTLLLQHGANTELKDRWNKRPIDDARRLGYEDLEILLETYGKNMKKELRVFGKQDPHTSRKRVLRSPQVVEEISEQDFEQSQTGILKSPRADEDLSKQEFEQRQKGVRKISVRNQDPNEEDPQLSLKGVLKSHQADEDLSIQESEQPQKEFEQPQKGSRNIDLKQESQQSQKKKHLELSPRRKESDK
ncbi:L-asparaginase-like [Lissotriton helveticus]